MYIQKRRIFADDEIIDDAAAVDVAPEASTLLFEAEDVAELVAEVTGAPVEVTAEDETVTFAVGEDEFVVEAEGDEEVLEASRINRRKKPVSASRRPARRPSRKPISASRKAKTVRKMPSKRR